MESGSQCLLKPVSIGNFFNSGFTFFDQKFRPHMTFHSKEQALSLFSGHFTIVGFKEVKVAALKPGTQNHYYVLVAKKLGNTTVQRYK